MMPRTLIPLTISLLILLASVGVYAGGYYFLARASTKAATLAKQASEKSAELERATRAHVALTTLEANEADINQYSLTKTDVVPFLEDLQAAGRPFGANITVVSVSDLKDGAHDRIALSLAVNGSFDSVMRTLGAIEYGPHDAVVTNLALSNTGSDEKAGQVWTATLTYSVGVRSAPATP